MVDEAEIALEAGMKEVAIAKGEAKRCGWLACNDHVWNHYTMFRNI